MKKSVNQCCVSDLKQFTADQRRQTSRSAADDHSKIDTFVKIELFSYFQKLLFEIGEFIMLRSPQIFDRISAFFNQLPEQFVDAFQAFCLQSLRRQIINLREKLHF